MLIGRTLAAFALALVFGLSVVGASCAQANVYYVAPGGSDANPGTLQSPWATISKANAMLMAGDLVYLRAGTYQQQIQPVNSGVLGSPITYAAFPGEQPVITNLTLCAKLSNRSYVILDGITCDGLAGLTVERGVDVFNGNYNIIQNCTFQNIFKRGIVLWGGAHHNEILDNTIRLIGHTVGSFPNGQHNGEGIQIGSNADNNLFEGNDIDTSRHNAIQILDESQYNVFRKNTLRNDWWRIVDATGPNSHHNVFEDNVFADMADTGSVSNNLPPAFKVWSPDGIIRRNVFHNNKYWALKATPRTASGNPRADHNKIYNNVFSQNGREGWSIEDSNQPTDLTDSNMFLNNIVSDNNTISPVQIEVFVQTGDINDNYFFHNIIRNQSNNPNGETTIWVVGPPPFAQASLSYYQSNFPTYFFGNESGDPDFETCSAAYGTPPSPFCVPSDGVAVDAGAFPTTAVGSDSGFFITVDDAGYFSDGMDLVMGDVVQLEGQTQRATVCDVDYDTNVIKLNTSLTWSDGDGLALHYEGSAPDMGVFETNDTFPVGTFVGCPIGGPPTGDTECSDGVDNDNDGDIDFPDDAQCQSFADTREKAGRCGLGFEVALLVPALLSLRRRARA